MWLSAEFEETFLTLSPKTSQQTRLKRRCCLSDKLIRVWWQNSPSRRRFSVSLWAITQVQRVPVHTPVNINALNLPTCDFWIWCMMNSTSMDGCNHVSVVMWAVCEKWVGVVYTEYDGLVFILLSIEISLFFFDSNFLARGSLMSTSKQCVRMTPNTRELWPPTSFWIKTCERSQTAAGQCWDVCWVWAVLTAVLLKYFFVLNIGQRPGRLF